MIKNRSKFLITFSVLALSLGSACNKETKNDQQGNTQTKDNTPLEKVNFETKSVEANGKENIKWYSFSEGVAKAKKEKKYMVVDFYTDWCMYCKKMDSETYSDKKLSDYINEKFVAIKVNAESKNSIRFDGKDITERELAMGFGVNSYPTIFFMAGEKDAVGTAPGFVDAKQFYTLSTFVATDAYKKTTFEKYKKSTIN